MSPATEHQSISIVIPTHDRPGSLVRLLRTLAADPGCADAEVIVVADGCTIDTPRAVARETLPYHVTVLERQPAGGAAAARNLGAENASGDLLLFIDDDIEPFANAVAIHRHLHDGAPRVVIGAPRVPRANTGSFRELAGWTWWEQQFERMRAPGYRFTYQDVLAAILSMPRALFTSSGAFDGSLWCREDFELGLRLVRRRVEFRFTEEGGGWHHENRTGDRLLARKCAEGAADVALARKHPWALPVLRIGQDAAALGEGTDLVRHLALGWPRLANIVAWMLCRFLPVLEWVRFRGTWRRLHAASLFLAYWRGAASVLRGPAGHDELCAAARTMTMPDVRELEIDAGGRLDDERRRIDLIRPDLLRVRFCGVPVGDAPLSPGSEPLRGSHLAAVLSGPLGRPMSAVRALAAVSPSYMGAARAEGWPATPGGSREARLADQPLGVAVLDLDQPVEPVRVSGAVARARILVRNRRRPIEWIDADVAEGVVSISSLRRSLIGMDDGLARAALGERITAWPERSSHPSMSVVVCTRDRPQLLERCLESLARLDYPDYEVVVVDNAPTTNATADIVRRFPVRYALEPTPGLDRARNRGIAESRHELIAFTDDDVVVDRSWLRGLAAGFADDDVGMVTGFVAPLSLQSEAERWFELGYGGMGKGFRARRLDASTATWRTRLAVQHLGVGANMAFRKTVLLRIGGFDPALDVGTESRGGGELDVFHRLLLEDTDAHYEPSAIVWHAHRSTHEGLRRQLGDNGQAFGVYLLRRFTDRRVPRGALLTYCVNWMAWLIERILRRLLLHEGMPMPYLVSELGGALRAPWAYRRTYAHERSLRTATREGTQTPM